MKKIPVIPNCYKDLPDRTKIGCKEVAGMFGYKNYQAATHCFKAGSIPAPDETVVYTKGGCKKKTNVWHLGTIRKWKNDNSI